MGWEDEVALTGPDKPALERWAPVAVLWAAVLWLVFVGWALASAVEESDSHPPCCRPCGIVRAMPHPAFRNPAHCRGLQHIGSTAAGVLAELGFGGNTPAMLLLRGWPGLVGEAAAAHCEPSLLRGALLEICTDSPGWSQELQMRQAELLDGLRKLLGSDAPTRLRFRTRARGAR